MNRKMYYKKFNRLKLLFVIILITLISSLALSILMFLIQSIWEDAHILLHINLIINILIGINFCSLFYCLYVVIEEIVFRKKYDSISNLLRSLEQTIKFRHFIKNNSDKNNPAYHDYNSAVTKSIINIQKDYIILIIFIPRTLSAKQLLDSAMPDIRETISSYNPSWYFSSPTKENNHFVISGRKK